MKDYIGLRTSMEQTLKDELAKLLNGSIDDLSGPIREAANRLAVAVRNNNQALVAEIQDALMLEIQKKEIQMKQGGNAVLDTVLGTGLNLLFGGAIAGMSAVKLG